MILDIKAKSFLVGVTYLVLTMGIAVMVFPFLWMVSTSMKAPGEVYSLSLIPSSFSLDSYRDIFKNTLFAKWMLNSLIVAIIMTLSVSLFDTIAGYILAKFTFFGKQIIFILFLSTLMVPTEMLIIPWYLVSSRLDGIDSYWGILFPGLMSGFGIFLMRQFMDSLPSELLDAARIDGMGEWRILFQIAIPLSRSALATLCILTFLGSWNSFIWPLIITQSDDMFTIPVGMAFFSSEAKDSSNWILIMTGATLSVIPLVVLFLIFQKQIIQGIATTGLK
ncbi:L-arabinose transport system permease protein AraQ [compost metagenome]